MHAAGCLFAVCTAAAAAVAAAAATAGALLRHGGVFVSVQQFKTKKYAPPYPP